MHPLGIAYGLGAGFLVLGLFAIVGWLLLAVAGVDDAGTAAVIAGAPLGAVAGGWVAGRTAVRSIFHGGLTGVLYAAGITFLSILDGSPATILTLGGFIIGGVLLGGFGGWLAERRRLSRATDSS